KSPLDREADGHPPPHRRLSTCKKEVALATVPEIPEDCTTSTGSFREKFMFVVWVGRGASARQPLDVLSGVLEFIHRPHGGYPVCRVRAHLRGQGTFCH